MSWTGPRDDELDSFGRLLVDLPPDRWPFCEPEEHEVGCLLREKAGRRGSFCDCDASAAIERFAAPSASATVTST